MRSAVAGAVLLAALQVRAQWMEQHVPLQPGVNAVFLTVDPVPAMCDEALAAYPDIRRVDHFLPPLGVMEFISDPHSPVQPTPHWLFWLPPDHEEAFLRNLSLLRANRAYFFTVAADAAPFTLVLKGRPVPAAIDWRHNAFTLTGLPVHPESPPDFQSFFSHTANIGALPSDGGEIYRIGADGRGQRIMQVGRTAIAAGQAYWIKSQRATDYVGPLRVRLDSGDRLSFSQQRPIRRLTIVNASPAEALEVRLRTLDSDDPPEDRGEPERAGPVALAYFNLDLDEGIADWVALPPELTQTLAPGESWTLRLTVRWYELADYSPTGEDGFAYMSLLEIADVGESLRQTVGVVATRDWRAP